MALLIQPVSPELLRKIEDSHQDHPVVIVRESPERVVILCDQCKQVLGVLVPKGESA